MIMHALVLVAVMTLLAGCDSSNVKRHTRLQRDSNFNSIQIDDNETPSRQKTKELELRLKRRPSPVSLLRPGSTLELTCEATGMPAPTVHWYRNDEPVYEHDMESNEVIHQGPLPTSLGRVISTLLVSRGNRDTYTCLVTSGSQTARASTVLHTIDGSMDFSERSRLQPLQPRIVAYYNTYMDTLGNGITLPCRAKGHPRPHVTWRDNNGTLIENDSRMKVLRSGELVISSLVWGYMGDFTCYASNIFGTDSISTFVYPLGKAG